MGASYIIYIKYIIRYILQPAPLPADVSPPLRRTYNYLGLAATQAVRRRRPFSPAQVEGEPIPVYYTVPLTFKLK